MSESLYGLAAVGTALVDVIAHASEDFIRDQADKHGMLRGAMVLVDERRAVELYAAMGPGVETSGGSAANTMAGFASFGGKGAFIGKTAEDQLGEVFRHDLKAQGVLCATQPLIAGPKTGRCLILVTPDGQRTMNTFLGAGSELTPDDIDPDLIASAEITYLEGYLFDGEQPKKAFIRAAEIAHEAGHRLALTLSDPFCVDRHRHDFIQLVQNHVDILFANEEEIKSLFMQQNFEDAISAARGHADIIAVTRGKAGAVIVSGDQIIEIKAAPVAKVIDTTGAGDQFAAGFLYGLTENKPLEDCGRLGALAAAEVISHIGPRPETPFAELMKAA